MSVTIKPRGASAARWTTVNYVLAENELGVEEDTGKLKVGNGVTGWNALPYVQGAGGGGATVSIDADGSLVVNGTTVELATDSGVASLLADLSGTHERLLTPTTVKTSAYTASAGELVRADVTSAGFTVTLPANPTVGTTVAVKNVTPSVANTLTIVASGGGLIDGDAAATTNVPKYGGGVFKHLGSNAWSVIGVGTATGPTGPAGPTGPQGVTGPTGPTGPAGSSAQVPEGRAKSATMTAVSIPGGTATSGAMNSQTQTAGRAAYIPIRVTSTISIDQFLVEVTSSVAASTMRVAIYNANTDWQPTTLAVDPAATIDTSSTGVKTLSVTPTQLTAGLYLIWSNCSAGVTLRAAPLGQNVLGYNPAMGGSAVIGQIYVAQTYGTPPPTGLAWDTVGGGSFNAHVFLRESTP